MPPRGSGNGEKNAEAWQKAAVSYLIDTMGERGLVACVPKIAGNGRTHGDIDPKIGAELEAGLQEAVNAVRRSQQLDDCGVELLWKKVILPLERECGTGDPVAFRVAAERRGLGGYAAVRPTRANSAHVTSASAAENAAPQPPPPPPPPPDSPPRKPLSPLRVLATQSSAPSCSTALATPPRETRRGVSRMAQIEGVKMAVETSMGALAALHTEGLEELGAQLNAAQLAALLRGHVQAAGTATAVVPLLGTTARSQLVVAALRDPETTRRALQALLSVASDEGVAPPSTLPAMLQAALPQLDDSELLDMLDALAYTLMSKPPFKEGDAECLRKCVAAIRRVNEFRNVSGHGQSNFVRSILEAYGGDDGPRLPLGTVLTWFTYYAHRIADDAHYGKNLSGLKFDADGGFYVEAMRDLKFHAGKAAMNFIRGPMFSGMVKSGAIDRGQYDISALDESQLRERLFFGAAIPSVRSLNGRPKPEEMITRGGTHGPIALMVTALHLAFHSQLSKQAGHELPRLSAEERKRKLQAIVPFDSAGAQRALHGERPAFVPPKAAKRKPLVEGATALPVPWWERPVPVLEEEPLLEGE